MRDGANVVDDPGGKLFLLCSVDEAAVGETVITEGSVEAVLTLLI